MKIINLNELKAVKALEARIQDSFSTERIKKLHNLDVDFSAIARDFYSNNAYNSLIRSSTNYVLSLMDDSEVNFTYQVYPAFRHGANNLNYLKNKYLEDKGKIVENFSALKGTLELEDIEVLINNTLKKLRSGLRKKIRKAISTQVSRKVTEYIRAVRFRPNQY